MSEHSQRMKWWEKFHNKEMCQDKDRNIAELRDLLRTAFLRLLHAKVDALNIDKILDNIILKVQAKYSDKEITDYLLRYTLELNEQEEDSND